MKTHGMITSATFCGLTIVAISLLTISAQAQPMRQARVHTVTERKPVVLYPATETVSPNKITVNDAGSYRYIVANGIPAHLVGRFPNRGNPNSIGSQHYQFRVTTTPTDTGFITPGGGWYWGIGLNGVPFEPGTAEVWHGDFHSGWNYDAMGGAIPLGLDANHAHVQPNGAYHYHGLPTGLMDELGWTEDAHSPLIGWAADGYPIYALNGDLGDGEGPRKLKSSYQLKASDRPGGNEPTGHHDGTFVQDWEYVPGSGDLDACNGAITYSPEFPNGTYAYFVTNDYPYVSRGWKGTPDQSFSKHRR